MITGRDFYTPFGLDRWNRDSNTVLYGYYVGLQQIIKIYHREKRDNGEYSKRWEHNLVITNKTNAPFVVRLFKKFQSRQVNNGILIIIFAENFKAVFNNDITKVE